jgi:acyl dehydratase
VKKRLQTQNEFEELIGSVLFESTPRVVTREQIQNYCRSLNQLDWFHFDEERSQEAGFGGIIAPGSLTFALVHSTFFEHVELVNLKALFVGSDRFRVLRPTNANETISLKMSIAAVEGRPEGFRVQYDFHWRSDTASGPISEGTFLVRYWPSVDHEG